MQRQSGKFDAASAARHTIASGSWASLASRAVKPDRAEPAPAQGGERGRLDVELREAIRWIKTDWNLNIIEGGDDENSGLRRCNEWT